MFFHLLYIHLFRPFLKYNPNNSPLPAHVSPRKLCTAAAQTISKLLRLYKRSHGLRQICNIAVYIAHSACTIHLLNLPEKNARRDIIHGVKHLEEIAEGWLCARRTLSILGVLAKQWNVELPEEAEIVLARCESKFGPYKDTTSTQSTPMKQAHVATSQPAAITSPVLQHYSMPLSNAASTTFFDRHGQPLAVGSLSSGAQFLRRTSEARSLPPNDASAFAYPRAQRDPATPASTIGDPRASLDATGTAANSAGNSPSQFFGGVDQLLREGQDWWLRDQSQLAMGFENWNFTPDDVVWLDGVTNGGVVGSPGIPGQAANGLGPISPGAGPGPANVAGLNGVNGSSGFGGALNSYNEQDWYQ